MHPAPAAGVLIRENKSDSEIHAYLFIAARHGRPRRRTKPAISYIHMVMNETACAWHIPPQGGEIGKMAFGYLNLKR
jgi:hypothetical protein